MTHQTTPHHHDAHHEHHAHHEHPGGHHPRGGNRAVAITLCVLVAIAAVLGFLVYKKNGGGDRSYADRPAMQAPVPGQQSSALPSAEVLNVPGPKATEAERQAHAELVMSSAVDTKSIDLSSCQANPTVSKFRNGAEITLVNKDSVPHVMVFNPTMTFPVPAKSSSKIKADFGFGPGIYGFGCDQSPVAVGLIVLTE